MPSFISLITLVSLISNIAGESQIQRYGRTSSVVFLTDASVASLVTDFGAES
jgi:hypothetical protein